MERCYVVEWRSPWLQGGKKSRVERGLQKFLPTGCVCFVSIFLPSLSAVGFSNRNALLIAQKLEFELNFPIICSEARLLG